MVTIGPVVLFCLLGVTFCLGRKKIRRVEGDLAADDFSTSQTKNSGPSANALPAHDSNSRNPVNIESAIPKRTFKANQMNESDAAQVRGGFDASRYGIGRSQPGAGEVWQCGDSLSLPDACSEPSSRVARLALETGVLGIRFECHHYLSHLSLLCALSSQTLSYSGSAVEPVCQAHYRDPYHPLPCIHSSLHRGEYRVEERPWLRQNGRAIVVQSSLATRALHHRGRLLLILDEYPIFLVFQSTIRRLRSP